MQALVYTAAKEVELQDHPIPQPKAGEVLLRVEASGVCGSDVDGFLGRSRKRKPPLVMGHEFTGRLMED
ncbi:MAG: alcohol dehydrogenase catalytic domain-containing protein, partial [Armatimonadota bacterium]